MTPSIALAEKVRERTNTGTDYAVAKALGISQSNLAKILEGKRGFGNEACFRAAEILGQDPKDIIAELELHRAGPDKKQFWEKRLPRILPAVAIWGLAAGVTHVTLDDSPVVRNGLTTTLHAIHYAHVALFILTVLGLTAFGLGRYAAKMVYKVKSALEARMVPTAQETAPVRSWRQCEWNGTQRERVPSVISARAASPSPWSQPLTLQRATLGGIGAPAGDLTP